VKRRVVLADSQSNDTLIYWLIEMPDFDCMTDSCDFRKIPKVEHLVLDYKKVKDHVFLLL